MNSSVILFGWNRSIPGREKVSAAHFDEFVKYLGGLQQKGAIQTFDIVFLDSHGGDLNGFFMIRGESPSSILWSRQRIGLPISLGLHCISTVRGSFAA